MLRYVRVFPSSYLLVFAEEIRMEHLGPSTGHVLHCTLEDAQNCMKIFYLTSFLVKNRVARLEGRGIGVRAFYLYILLFSTEKIYKRKIIQKWVQSYRTKNYEKGRALHFVVVKIIFFKEFLNKRLFQNIFQIFS